MLKSSSKKLEAKKGGYQRTASRRGR